MNIYALKSHIQNTIEGFVFKGNNFRHIDSTQVDSTVLDAPVIPEEHMHRQVHRSQIIHIVKRGETVYAISRKYHVTPNQILKANKLKNSRGIKPGQRLIIPKR
jgi:membrane-bound lytic murein transglycosylase D